MTFLMRMLVALLVNTPSPKGAGFSGKLCGNPLAWRHTDGRWQRRNAGVLRRQHLDRTLAGRLQITSRASN